MKQDKTKNLVELRGYVRCKLSELPAKLKKYQRPLALVTNEAQ